MNSASSSKREVNSYSVMVNALTARMGGQALSKHIAQILQSIGEFIDVSRAYVFEDDRVNRVTNNTYEWCADGVEPQKEALQNVPIDSIAAWYDVMNKEGLVKASDIAMLPIEIYEVLEPQGIKSIVVLPLYVGNDMFGFIGFDECSRRREWTVDEIDALRALAGLVASFITLFNAEHRISRANQMFRTVLDNIETPIYVTDPTNYHILFANRKFAEEMHKNDVEGKLCYEVARNRSTPCEDCPVRRLQQMEMGKIINWEVYNEPSKKWYYCTDSLIEWVDGRTVHIQTALDITGRKSHEEQLVYNAAHDVMTGIRNRTSGLALLHEMIEQGKKEGFVLTFGFIDIDNLKQVNDNHGHAEGDRLIATFVDVVKRYIRASDVFARIGGDEFIIVLRSCTQSNAMRIISNIHKEIDKLNASNRLPYKMSFSEGLEEILPESEHTVDTIIMNADRKMYHKKQSKSCPPRAEKLPD